MYSHSYTMMTSNLNPLISNNDLDEYCIFRVNKFQAIADIIDGKRVIIIIMDMDVLRSGAQVGQKIGSPIAIQADGTINENDRQAAQKAGKRIGDQANGDQPLAKKPLQQSNNRPRWS